MLATIVSGAVLGVEAYGVRVEVDLARGLPSMSVVGLPQGAVREGRERVSAALKNSGYPFPPRRITVNLAPADVPKAGSAFDLPIALGVLVAEGRVPSTAVEGACFVGELGLDGALRPVRGALAVALHCRRAGLRRLLLPAANVPEAAVVEGLDVIGIARLSDAVAHLTGRRVLTVAPARPVERGLWGGPDFADVRGQAVARRALEVAAAGGHNALLLGPPGSGKSMMARRIPSILPPLTVEEALEATLVHSVAGRLPSGTGLLASRVFRAPHHAISDAGLIGGGGIPRPGEASLAHHGVLFLDELPEFRRSALEALRQPLEDGVIHLGRARAAVRLPARFMLVGAMNPCPCGYHGTDRCTCTEERVRRYRSRVSGPLLDRIDVQLMVSPTRAAELASRPGGEPSDAIRARVAAARERQVERYRGTGIFCNAQVDARGTRVHCSPDAPGAALLEAAIHRLGLSGRAFDRVLRVARTIADLEGRAGVEAGHVAEAIQYRALDRRSREAGQAETQKAGRAGVQEPGSKSARMV